MNIFAFILLIIYTLGSIFYLFNKRIDLACISTAIFMILFLLLY